VELTYTAQTKTGKRYGELLIMNFDPGHQGVGADGATKEKAG